MPDPAERHGSFRPHSGSDVSWGKILAAVAGAAGGAAWVSAVGSGVVALRLRQADLPIEPSRRAHVSRAPVRNRRRDPRPSPIRRFLRRRAVLGNASARSRKCLPEQAWATTSGRTARQRRDELDVSEPTLRRILELGPDRQRKRYSVEHRARRPQRRLEALGYNVTVRRDRGSRTGRLASPQSKRIISWGSTGTSCSLTVGDPINNR
jgi:hypothetical protein